RCARAAARRWRRGSGARLRAPRTNVRDPGSQRASRRRPCDLLKSLLDFSMSGVVASAPPGRQGRHILPMNALWLAGFIVGVLLGRVGGGIGLGLLVFLPLFAWRGRRRWHGLRGAAVLMAAAAWGAGHAAPPLAR